MSIATQRMWEKMKPKVERPHSTITPSYNKSHKLIFTVNKPITTWGGWNIRPSQYRRTR